MAALIIVGDIYFIGDKQTIVGKTGRSITKRELYLTVERRDPDTYEVFRTSYPKFEFTGNKCDILDDPKFQVGTRVAVYFSVEGNFFETGKNQDGTPSYGHINNISGYRVQTMEEYKVSLGRQQTQQSNVQQQPQPQPVQAVNAPQSVFNNPQTQQAANPAATGFAAPQNFVVPQPNGQMG